MDPIINAAQLVGGQRRLAEKLGVSQPTISEWRTGRRQVPRDRCPLIEKATGGKVACEMLRPDLRWVRVPDADWPNPMGRPLRDVAG